MLDNIGQTALNRTSGSENSMICPYCNHSFPLTWVRYLKSPLARHTCPRCGLRSRFRWRLSYFVLVVLACLVFVGVAFTLTALIFQKDWRRIVNGPYLIIVFALGCAVVMALERFYQENCRTLEKGPQPHVFASPSALCQFAIETAMELRKAGFNDAGDGLESAAMFVTSSGREWLGRLGKTTAMIQKRGEMPKDLRSRISRIRKAATSKRPYG